MRGCVLCAQCCERDTRQRDRRDPCAAGEEAKSRNVAGTTTTDGSLAEAMASKLTCQPGASMACTDDEHFTTHCAMILLMAVPIWVRMSSVPCPRKPEMLRKASREHQGK